MVTRTLIADSDWPFKTHRRTAGSIVLNSTSWANVETSTDLAVIAAVGDVLEASINGMFENENVFAVLDAATLVAGSPVTYFSSGTTTQAGNGVGGWAVPSGGVFISAGPPVWLTVVSGDISGGTVTVRLRYKTLTAANRTLVASTTQPFHWALRNLGPAAP